MRIGKIEHHGSKPRTQQSEAVILFSVADHTFAIAAQAVEEIRNADELRKIDRPSGHSKVKHTLQRDGKSYFVVDGGLHFGLQGTRATRVLLLRDAAAAFSVDNVDRMAEIAALHSLPRAFAGRERDWYRGLALIGEGVIPVLNPSALLTAEELADLQNLKPAASQAVVLKGAVPA